MGSVKSIGQSQEQLGEKEGRLERLEKGLLLAQQLYGSEHPQVATIYNNLGLAHEELGDSKKALVYFEKSLDISSENEENLRDLRNIAISFSGLGISLS